MTHSALLRFAQAVDIVMNADDLDARERVKLIDCWAYQYKDSRMLDQLDAAIKRCQGEAVHPTSTSIVESVTGEVVAYNPEGK